jgi:hypothetical protein
MTFIDILHLLKIVGDALHELALKTRIIFFLVPESELNGICSQNVLHVKLLFFRWQPCIQPWVVLS